MTEAAQTPRRGSSQPDVGSPEGQNIQTYAVPTPYRIRMQNGAPQQNLPPDNTHLMRNALIVGGAATSFYFLNKLKQMRDENVENAEKGVDKSTHTYYIESVPHQSEKVKEQHFGGLREKGFEDNMNDEERLVKNQMAKMVQVVVDRRKAYKRPVTFKAVRDLYGLESEKHELQELERKLFASIPNQDVGDFIFEETGNDLTGLFVNKKTQELVLAIRGLLPFTDMRDSFQLGAMARSMIMEADRAEGFGKEYSNDRNLIDRDYLQAKKKYPGYKMTVTGHSRGGRGAIFLGRRYNIDYHAFSPVGNRADYEDSVPRSGGRLYYHYNDPVSMHFHQYKGKTEETHFESFNNRFYPHSLNDFYDDKTSFYKHNPIIVDEEANRELAKEVVIEAQDYVLSDLGIFDSTDFILVDKKKADFSVPTRKPTSVVYFDSLDPLKKNTHALNLETPSERPIFNEYVPSVFTDLNLRPAKKFQPMTFEDVDGDKNDKISLKELNDYLSKRGYDDATIKDLFETYDVDNNKSISRAEFTDLKRMV